MTPREEQLGRMGRGELLAEIARLEREVAAAYANLTATQERCTELLQEARDARLERLG